MPNCTTLSLCLWCSIVPVAAFKLARITAGIACTHCLLFPASTAANCIWKLIDLIISLLRDIVLGHVFVCVVPLRCKGIITVCSLLICSVFKWLSSDFKALLFKLTCEVASMISFVYCKLLMADSNI